MSCDSPCSHLSLVGFGLSRSHRSAIVCTFANVHELFTHSTSACVIEPSGCGPAQRRRQKPIVLGSVSQEPLDLCWQPKVGLHVSSVQPTPSLQSRAPPPLQMPPPQVSPVV